MQNPGLSMEAFFCGVKFPGALRTFVDAKDAIVATISGPEIDLANRNENPSFWGIDQRISPSLWLPDSSNNEGFRSTYSETSTFVAPTGDSDEFRR